MIVVECGDSLAAREPRGADAGLGGDGEAEETEEQASSVWDEEVSMLNVTTKTFGAGERGWVGRTVSIRRVAGRWCHFKRYEAEEGGRGEE